MRCADCGFYECALRTQLGGCPNGEKSEHSQIITTPDTRPYDLGHGPFEKGYQPAGSETREEIAERIAGAVAYLKSHGWVSVECPPGFDEIKNAASALVDAVERYVSPKPGDKYCSRNVVLTKCYRLKKLLNNESK